MREVASASAPMARYGGRTSAGAAALSRALKLLAAPPAAQQPLKDLMTAEDIARRVGRSPRVIPQRRLMAADSATAKVTEA